MARKDTTPTWLQEVKQAAKLNYLRNLKEQEEKQRIAKAKEEGRLDELVQEELDSRKQSNKKTTKKSEEKEGN